MQDDGDIIKKSKKTRNGEKMTESKDVTRNGVNGWIYKSEREQLRALYQMPDANGHELVLVMLKEKKIKLSTLRELAHIDKYADENQPIAKVNPAVVETKTANKVVAFASAEKRANLKKWLSGHLVAGKLPAEKMTALVDTGWKQEEVISCLTEMRESDIPAPF